MKVRPIRLLTAVVAAGFLSACGESGTSTSAPTAPPSFAKGGVGGGGGGSGGGGTGSTRCATLTVANNPQSVRRLVMPDIKYNIENCGTEMISMTVSVVETAGFLSALCPSPVVAPAHLTLSAHQKISATTPVFRGPCGMTSNVDGVFAPGMNAWQGHNLLLTLTDDGTGAVLSSAPFSWQDILNPGI